MLRALLSKSKHLQRLEGKDTTQLARKNSLFWTDTALDVQSKSYCSVPQVKPAGLSRSGTRIDIALDLQIVLSITHRPGFLWDRGPNNSVPALIFAFAVCCLP